MNLDLRMPWGYSRSYKTLDEVRAILLAHHHPEYVRRIIPWLHSKNGTIGVGGGWRPDGTQPDKPGFAPEGRSFHQNQRYADGFIGACAVDLVAANGDNIHRSPYWREVPAQDSADATRWGLHCNVSSEPWHMQPIEIDGWLSWTNKGCPAPRPNYPLPTDEPAPAPKPEPTPVPSPTRIPLEDSMPLFVGRQLEPDGSLKAFWYGALSEGRRWADRRTIGILLRTNRVFDCGTGRSLAGALSGDSITAVSEELLDAIIGPPVGS